LVYKNLPVGTKYDLKMNGLRVNIFCQSYLKTAASIYNLMKMFVGGLTTYTWLPVFGTHVPKYMVDANVEFLKNTMQWELEPKEISFIDYDESNFKTGDVLAIFRLDGVDQLIMYGTGSTIGHCTMTIWFEGELWVVEAMENVFWPKKNVQRNRYKEWIQMAKDADYHVSHLSLTEKARARFNETAVKEFFFRTEGLPYGFHNFLYGWIDSEVMAPIIPHGGMSHAFTFFEGIMPHISEIFISQGLNKRMNTKNLTMREVVIEAAKRNLTSQ
jgi:hypothetical protein